MAEALDDTKAGLLRCLQMDVEGIFGGSYTGGDGMSRIYAEKKEEALAVFQMGADAANALDNHGAAEFPVLSASVPTEAASLYAAAELVISSYEQWAARAGAIERTRLHAKKAISEAPDATAARSAYEAIRWPE